MERPWKTQNRVKKWIESRHGILTWSGWLPKPKNHETTDDRPPLSSGGGDEFTMDDKMLMELLALGIDAKMSVSLGAQKLRYELLLPSPVQKKIIILPTPAMYTLYGEMRR